MIYEPLTVNFWKGTNTLLGKLLKFSQNVYSGASVGFIVTDQCFFFPIWEDISPHEIFRKKKFEKNDKTSKKKVKYKKIREIFEKKTLLPLCHSPVFPPLFIGENKGRPL